MLGEKETYKLILIGDAGVGKTLLLTRFVGAKLQAETLPTISVEFFDKRVRTESGKEVRVELWDTGKFLFDLKRSWIRKVQRNRAFTLHICDGSDTRV